MPPSPSSQARARFWPSAPRARRAERLERELLALVEQTAAALGLELSRLALGRLRVEPALHVPSERQLIAWGLDRDSARFCRQQAKNGDSSFWPAAGLVLLRSQSRVHMAEEAAHVLRHALTPLHVPNDPVDAFYMRAVEEGLAFFASKLLCPRRRAPAWAILAQREDKLARQVAQVARAHVAQEAGERQEVSLFPSAPAVSDAVTHLLGYRLGDALYRAHKESLCDERKVRALFLRTTSGRGEACLLYWQLTLALRDFLSPPGPRYSVQMGLGAKSLPTGPTPLGPRGKETH